MRKLKRERHGKNSKHIQNLRHDRKHMKQKLIVLNDFEFSYQKSFLFRKIISNESEVIFKEFLGCSNIGSMF